MAHRRTRCDPLPAVPRHRVEQDELTGKRSGHTTVERACSLNVSLKRENPRVGEPLTDRLAVVRVLDREGGAGCAEGAGETLHVLQQVYVERVRKPARLLRCIPVRWRLRQNGAGDFDGL